METEPEEEAPTWDTVATEGVEVEERLPLLEELRLAAGAEAVAQPVELALRLLQALPVRDTLLQLLLLRLALRLPELLLHMLLLPLKEGVALLQGEGEPLPLLLPVPQELPVALPVALPDTVGLWEALLLLQAQWEALAL